LGNRFFEEDLEDEDDVISFLVVEVVPLPERDLAGEAEASFLIIVVIVFELEAR